MHMHITFDSKDRIAGYPVLQQHPVPGAGRFVMIDRGTRYRQRWVVAWHPQDARGWADPVFHESYDAAIETLVGRATAARAYRS